MDADCTYPGEEIPSLVKMLIDEDLDFITCDRLSKAEDGSMSMLHSLGIRLSHSLPGFSSSHPFQIHRAVCGSSDVVFLIARISDPSTMEWRCLKSSRFGV